MFRTGHPLRSEDLRRELLASTEEARVLAQRLRNAERRLRMIELALLAAPTAHVDVPQWPVLRVPLVPDEDTEMLGSCVVTRRIDSTNPIADVTITGEEELLLEGSVWAALAATPEATFTASVDPSYTIHFNELVLPYVAGEYLNWRLIGVDNTEHFYNINRTLTLRTSTMRSFAGVVELVSRSRFAAADGYVHTAGGILIRRSTWLSEGSAVGSQRVGRAGSFRIAAYRLYPSNRAPLSISINVDGSSVAPNSTFSADEDSVIQVSVILDGLNCASHVEFILEEV